MRAAVCWRGSAPCTQLWKFRIALGDLLSLQTVWHGCPLECTLLFYNFAVLLCAHPALPISVLWYDRVDSDSQVSPSRLTEDAYDLERAGEYLAETGLLPHLLTAVHQLAFSPSDDRISQFGERTTTNCSMRF